MIQNGTRQIDIDLLSGSNAIEVTAFALEVGCPLQKLNLNLTYTPNTDIYDLAISKTRVDNTTVVLG